MQFLSISTADDEFRALPNFKTILKRNTYSKPIVPVYM